MPVDHAPHHACRLFLHRWYGNVIGVWLRGKTDKIGLVDSIVVKAASGNRP